MTTFSGVKDSDELNDLLTWVACKYANFRAFVRSLVPQEKRLEPWADWLDTLPLAVFLVGGDGELKGVRESTTDGQRTAEAARVLDRFALEYDFDLDKITAADKIRLRRYLLLFASC